MIDALDEDPGAIALPEDRGLNPALLREKELNICS
jgi:hypothetical protein